MRALNATVHALSDHHGTHHVHAAERPWSTRPGSLSADRLHPSETGHRLLARDFHAVLAAAGLAGGPGPGLATDGPPSGRASSAWWMATRGTRWVAERCTDLLPGLLRLAAAEYRCRAHGDAARLDAASDRAMARALAALGLAPAVPGYPRTGARTGTKRILVPGGDWAAAGSEASGTTPMTG